MARPAVDRELLATLDDKLGPANTDKLLALVPPDASQLVTKQDLAVVGAELRTEMADLRGELRTDLANLRTELKGDMAELRTELKGEMAELRTELKGEMAELRTELKTDMAQLRSEFSELRSDVKTDIASLDARMERRLRSHLTTTIVALGGIVSLTTAIQMLAA
jgi:Skp family chaperone for outer membrane proteins